MNARDDIVFGGAFVVCAEVNYVAVEFVPVWVLAEERGTIDTEPEIRVGLVAQPFTEC